MGMKDEPNIIKELREEDRCGKLRRHSSEQKPFARTSDDEEDSVDTMITILRQRIEENIKPIDLGDPSEKYRIIFENSAVAIMLTDENERIVHWNKYTEALLGMNRDELMMKPVKFLYPPEEWVKIRSENVRQKGIQYHLETKMIGKNKKVMDVDLSLSVLKDSIGNVIGSIGIVKDNTKRRQMELALISSEKKFQQLYEKAPVPYQTVTLDGRVMNVNEKWCKTLGYEREEVIGKSLFDFIHGDEQETARSLFDDRICRKNLTSSSHEQTYVMKNGETHVFMMHDFPSVDDTGAVSSVLTTMEDITERKKAEEELRKAHYWLEKRVEERTLELTKSNAQLKKKINEHKRIVGELHIELERLQKSQKRIELQNMRLKKLDQMKSNFLNITSHELRTPIASIKGYIEVLLMSTLGPITEEQKQGLEVALRNVTQLDHLIQDILDISRLESGTMKFTPEKAKIERIIDDATDTIQSSAERKQIRITKEIEQGMPDLVVDQERIKQVLTNLLNNAIKFSPEKSPITVRAKKESDDVLVEVQDLGRGIPKSKQKKIFELFYQVDSGMDKKFGGSGLGLAISRGIVLSHGGTIWVESEANKGSTFRFTLPIQPIQNMEGKFKEVDIFRF
jgi:PAS domain S-box-containing protein